MFQCKGRGFVLPAVLVFLQLFSWLSVSSLMMVSMDIKSQVHQWQKQEYLMQTHLILEHLEDELSAGIVTCLISHYTAAEMAKKPLAWWQAHTCHGYFQKVSYYYAVESLGMDVCGIVSEKNNEQKRIANYYRIRLLSLPDKQKNTQLRLQSTLVVGANAAASCQGEEHPVTLGRQTYLGS